MEVYTYSEARQKLATLLDSAKEKGGVVIKRRDGSRFRIVPEVSNKSPLDVGSVRANITTEEIVCLLREERERAGRFE